MVQVRWMRLACGVLLAAGLARVHGAIGASAVEELARRMPDDVLALVGTSGGDALKGAFEKTTLGRIWNDPGVRTFYEAVETELLARAEQESGDASFRQSVDTLNYVHMALSRPLIAGVAQVPVHKGPPLAGFAILDAGPRKEEFAAIVGKLEAMVGLDCIVDKEIGSLKVRALADRKELPLYWGWAGDRLFIAANDHQDKLPPDLQTLVDTVDLPPECLESKRKPEYFDGPSYIYISGQDSWMSARNVLAYENPAFCSEGVNVLFMDSHVEFMKPEGFRREMEATYRRLKKKMPEIKFDGE